MKGDLVEDVKSRLSIEDVIGEYIELKRAGRNLKGLSPFNAEKTPSFMVSPEKQIWHDFSSGKGGSMFGFIMEVEGMSFREALELLAKKAGLDISQYRSQGRGNDKLKQRLLEILAVSARFYQAQLLASSDAKKYVVDQRGFNQESVRDFMIGYSPKTWTALVDYLRAKGYKDQDIRAAGLGVDRRRGFADMFVGRIMIALMDPQGQVIGYTARLLEANDEAPKYINTPQTMLYDKSRHVFGLSQAKEAIRRSGFVVVAEGNLDVVSSHQAGIRQVVATAGTAMTLDHLKTLARFTDDIRLSFDADAAGLAATERAIALAQAAEVQLSIVDIPSGKDPDELVRQDRSLWESVINQPTYAVDWLIDRYRHQHDLTSAKGKRDFTDVILQTVKNLKDPVEKEHYTRKISELAQTSYEAVAAKSDSMSGSKTAVKKMKRTQTQPSQTKTLDTGVYEDMLIGLMLLYPITVRVIEPHRSALQFKRHGRQQVFDYCLDNSPVGYDPDNLPSDLKQNEECVKIATFTAEELYRDLDSNERLREAQDLVQKIIKTDHKNKIDELRVKLQQAEDAGDDKLAAQILDDLNQHFRK